MNLTILDGHYAFCRLDPSASVPDWALQGGFFSICKTEDEISIVCEEDLAPPGTQIEKGWGLIKVEGPLDFSLTGVLSSLTKPLADNKISLSAISTFDTDYLLIKKNKIEDATRVLESSGFQFLKNEEN